MPHFLFRDAEQRLLPASHKRSFVRGHLIPTQRIRGVKVLDHEAMFDAGIDVQQHKQVVPPGQIIGFYQILGTGRLFRSGQMKQMPVMGIAHE